MAIWKVTVAPKENRDAWKTFVEQGIIGIGWASRVYDCERAVIAFGRIEVGDWVLAHVPESHGGGPATALGVGRVIGSYTEMKRADLPAGDHWTADFRRQYPVEWTLGTRKLSDALEIFIGTVRQLNVKEEHAVRELYGL